MLIESVFAASIAVLAVFGLYCILKLFFGNFCSGVPAAVVIQPFDDLEILKMKIREAEALCLCGRCSVIVLIPEDRKNDKKIMEYIENAGYLSFYYSC